MSAASWEDVRIDPAVVLEAEVPAGAVGTRASDSGACTWCLACSKGDHGPAFAWYGPKGDELEQGYLTSLQGVTDGGAHFVFPEDIGEGEPCERCGVQLVE